MAYFPSVITLGGGGLSRTILYTTSPYAHLHPPTRIPVRNSRSPSLTRPVSARVRSLSEPPRTFLLSPRLYPHLDAAPPANVAVAAAFCSTHADLRRTPASYALARLRGARRACRSSPPPATPRLLDTYGGPTEGPPQRPKPPQATCGAWEYFQYAYPPLKNEEQAALPPASNPEGTSDRHRHADTPSPADTVASRPPT